MTVDTEAKKGRLGSGKTPVFSVAVVAVVVIAFLAGYLISPMMLGEPGAGKEFTIIDDVGRRVVIPPQVERIISLAPSNTEILFALGLGSKVVGVDEMSDYPAEAAEIPKVGGWSGYNMETIASLDPDLIIASGINPPTLISDLEEKGYPVLVLDPETLENIFRDIIMVGEATNSGDAARSLVDSLRERVNSITTVTSNSSLYRPRVYIELDSMLFTFGPGSFGHDLIQLAGGRNIASNAISPYPQLSNEDVVASDPEIIVSVFTNISEIQSREGWENIEAVKNGRLYSIDGDLLSRPGPRIVDGLEELAVIIHPELFG